MWACSKPLPFYRHRRGGLTGARRRWETICLLDFIWSILQKISSCELGYCRQGNSPFVFGLKALGFPSHSIWMRWRGRGEG
jgi:hypothetical protein